LADSECCGSGWLLDATGVFVVGVVLGYSFEGTFGVPQAIPVADHRRAVTLNWSGYIGDCLV